VEELKNAEQLSTEEVKDIFQSSLDDYDEFDKYAWSKGEGYKLPNYKMMEEKLEGMEAGLYLFAGESNTGKSAIMMNIMYDLCTYSPNKLFGLYFSLDDSKKELIPRVIAMDQLIPISVASKPQRYQKMIDDGVEGCSVYQEWLEKRTTGLQNLRNNVSLFKIEDSTRIKSSEDMHNTIRQTLLYVKAIDPEFNLVVAIDSLNDIKFSEQGFNSTVDKHSEIARMVKDWATDLNIIIFGSSHLRKINATRRPTLDDLKESGEYVYEASVVFLLYSDVSKNKQGAKIYYNSEVRPDKQPVIEIDWAKNKKSAFKGRTYCYFAPEYSKSVECDVEDSKRYSALIYEG
jgi:replicative DNA helicase